jgi:hypothetical protein
MDIFKQLPIASYDGIQFPISSYSWGFAQSQAQYKFIFKDQQFLQPLGRENKTFRFSIPFYEDITEVVDNLYTEVFPQFLAACEDGEPKILNTPDFGEYRVMCIRFEPSYDPTKRAGVSVDVEFIEAPEFGAIEEENKFSGPENINTLAARLDQDLEEAVIPGYTPPAGGFQNPLRLATAVLDQVSLARDQYKAQLDNVVYEIDRLNIAIDNTSDSQNWRVKRQAQELKRAIYETRQGIDIAGQRIVEETLNSPKNLLLLSAEVGLTLKEFLQLNSSLAMFILVPAGTKILRPEKKK